MSAASLAFSLLALGGFISPVLIKYAVREDRTHDLRIMRPTRWQLRYHRLGRMADLRIFAHKRLVGEEQGGTAFRSAVQNGSHIRTGPAARATRMGREGLRYGGSGGRGRGEAESSGTAGGPPPFGSGGFGAAIARLTSDASATARSFSIRKLRQAATQARSIVR
jgi:hypothetical protein